MNTISLAKKVIQKQKYLYLMLLPGFIITFIFAYVPLTGWLMAFKKYELGLSLWDAEWSGLSQFKAFFLDTGDAMYVVRNTVVINVITIFVNLFVACMLAILLNEIRSGKFKKVVQTSSLFPFFISWAIIYMIFHTFLASESGVLNEVLVSIGIVSEGINFLGEPKFAWGLMVFINAWKFTGYNCVIFLSAIANIDQEQYEAADIDGAGRFEKILYITVPGLLPTLQILFIMNIGWIFSANFEQYYLFTNSLNWEHMEVFDVYIYKYGMQMLDFSYATAVGIIKTIASIIMLLTVNGISKKMSGRAIL